MTKITTLSKWKQIFSRKEEKNGWLVSSSHSSKKVFINFHFQPFSVFGASKFLRSFFHNFSLCTGWRVWSRIKLVKYYSGVLLQAQNWSSNWCPYSGWYWVLLNTRTGLSWFPAGNWSLVQLIREPIFPGSQGLKSHLLVGHKDVKISGQLNLRPIACETWATVTSH